MQEAIVGDQQGGWSPIVKDRIFCHSGMAWSVVQFYLIGFLLKMSGNHVVNCNCVL
jgi:hypothetical protein